MRVWPPSYRTPELRATAFADLVRHPPQNQDLHVFGSPRWSSILRPDRSYFADFLASGARMERQFPDDFKRNAALRDRLWSASVFWIFEVLKNGQYRFDPAHMAALFEEINNPVVRDTSGFQMIVQLLAQHAPLHHLAAENQRRIDEATRQLEARERPTVEEPVPLQGATSNPIVWRGTSTQFALLVQSLAKKGMTPYGDHWRRWTPHFVTEDGQPLKEKSLRNIASEKGPRPDDWHVSGGEAIRDALADMDQPDEQTE